MTLSFWFESLWYHQSRWRWLLWPLSMLYAVLMNGRRWILQRYYQVKFPLPIIVVGNLTVGGVGKTPVVIALAKALTAKGLRVGIVSRGYGATLRDFPHEVVVHDTAEKVGDEPLLLVNKTACPVVIAPKRVEAVRYLMKHYPCDVILSDDGLQHYAMGRSIEIAVIDGLRGLGNGLCLPAGPLREPPPRLAFVDFVLVNSGQWPNAYPMRLTSTDFIQLTTGLRVPSVGGGTVAAVAGIGHPKRFFLQLQQMGVSVTEYPFPDHHAFRAADLQLSHDVIVMTEKDAIKCHAFATNSMYYLPVEAEIDPKFWEAFWRHPSIKKILPVVAGSLVE